MYCRYFPMQDASSPYFQARPDNSTVPAASVAAMPQRPGAPEDAWFLQVASPLVPDVRPITGLCLIRLQSGQLAASGQHTAHGQGPPSPWQLMQGHTCVSGTADVLLGRPHALHAIRVFAAGWSLGGGEGGTAWHDFVEGSGLLDRLLDRLQHTYKPWQPAPQKVWERSMRVSKGIPTTPPSTARVDVLASAA